ncbi:DNA repair protein RadC [Escherichia coli]|nr:DNA repair protein RadC [Escherichia coli]ELK7689189.1 DNA repair protein RadC [Escherichia coli]ELK7691782.1 DNA repair protein RadC [Escherichia coli]HAH3421356.1 hypothetical protein [Escherichia coli]
MTDMLLLPPPGLPPTVQRAIKRAQNHLEKYLRKPGILLTNPTLTHEWLKLKLSGLEREVFMVLYLDSQLCLLEHETLFLGTINHIEVHPREIIKSALRCNAARVILVHNHPSGVTNASKSDRVLTTRIVKTLDLVDVQVVDHLIIGNGNCLSFAERGWL